MYELQAPESKICVRPGNIIKLNRFDDEQWIVNLGWFSYAGNKPMNGWYLVSTSNKDKVKPLNMSDLDDIYVVDIGEVKEDYKELDPEIKKLIHDLKLQVEELTKEVNQLVKEVEAKDEIIAQKGQEILELQRQIRELQSQIEELESQHRLDADTITTLNAQVTAQAQIIAEKAAEIRELTARVAELAEENELLTQQHQEDLATIQQQASTIQEQAQSIADLTAENETLTDENDRLTDENESLVAQHQQDTATIQSQGETITQQSSQITELNGEVTELTTENTRLEALTDTQRETIQNMLDNPPEPKLYTPPIVTPSGSVQQINPPTGYDGLSNAVVDQVTAEVDSDIQPENIREGVDILGVEGTYNPFPEHSVGGIYITEVDEDGYPVKFLIKDWEQAPAIFPKFYNNSSAAISSLQEIKFENCQNIETVADYFCQGLSSLKHCVLPDSLTRLTRDTFNGSGIRTFTFPPDITNVATNTFFSCKGLVSVVLNSKILNLSETMFYSCTALKTINIPASIRAIGNMALVYCTALENITIENGFNCNKLNLSASTLYSVETIVSWLEALADRTGETAYTLTMGSTNLNKLTAEQKAIATNKNWNLA